MDFHELEALREKVRAARVRAQDLVRIARVLRSECMENRLERAEARHVRRVVGVASDIDALASERIDGAVAEQPEASLVSL